MTTSIPPPNTNEGVTIVATTNKRPNDINELQQYILDETGIQINYQFNHDNQTDYVSEFFGGKDQYHCLFKPPTPPIPTLQQQSPPPEVKPTPHCKLLPPSHSISGQQWLLETIDTNLKWSNKLSSFIAVSSPCSCIIYQPSSSQSKSQYKTFYNIRMSAKSLAMSNTTSSSRINIPVLIKLWCEYHHFTSLDRVVSGSVRWQHLSDNDTLVDVVSFKEASGICINPEHWMPIIVEKEEKPYQCKTEPTLPSEKEQKKCIIEVKEEVKEVKEIEMPKEEEEDRLILPQSTEDEINWATRYISSDNPSSVAIERSNKYLSDHPFKEAALVKTLVPPAEFVNVDPLLSIEMRNELASKLSQSQYNNSDHLIFNLPPVIRGLVTMSEDTYKSLSERGKQQELQLKPSVLRSVLKRRKKRVIERLLSTRLDYARKNLPRSGQFARVESLAKPIALLEPPSQKEILEKDKVDLLNLQIGWSSHRDDGSIRLMDVFDQDADDIDILSDGEGQPKLASHYSISPLVALDQSRKPAIKLPVPCFFDDTDWAVRYPLGPFESYEKAAMRHLDKYSQP